MAGPNAPYSQLDFTQVLRQVFDKTTDRLRVDTGATISLDGEMEVAFSDLAGDSVKIGDGSGHYLAVNNDGSINVATTITGTPDINLQKIAGNTTSVNNGTADVGTLRVAISSNNSPLAVTQSGAWTVSLTPESIEIGTVDQGTATTVGNAWPFKITDGLSTAAVSVAGALKIDGSAVTQPISGTVSVNPITFASPQHFILDSGTLTSITNTVTVSQGTAANLNATIGNASGASAVNIQDGGNSITVDGSISFTAPQHVIVDSGNTIVTNAGTFAVQAAQSGTWNLTNISGTISLPTGASTSALQTSGNTSLSSIDSKVPANLTVTSNRLLVDGSGVTQPISGTITANAGTNLNTSALALDSNLTTLNSKFSVLGQNTMANSTPVVLASNQSTINTITPDTTSLSNNITGAGQTIAISTVAMGAVIVQVTGTFVATLTFQATVDGTNWVSWRGEINSTKQVNISVTSADVARFNTGGIQQFRVNCTSYTSGTAVVSIVANKTFGGMTSYSSSIGISGNASVPVSILSGNNPVIAASISNIKTQSYVNPQSTSNSSTANLAAGASFTGIGYNIVSESPGNTYNSISVFLFADQNCTIQVQQTSDLIVFTNWDVVDTYTTTANIGDSRNFYMEGIAYRVIVTNNGASTTTAFRLSTNLTTANYPLPRALSSSGNLKTAISEALPAGTNVIGHIINDASSAVIGHVIVDSGTISTITNPVTISQATASSLNATVVGTGTFAVQAAQSGNWSTRIQDTNGATIALGQTTISNSIPVTLANNQPGLPAAVTFTQPNYIDGATSAISLDINGNLRTVEINSDNIIDLLQQLIIETRAMRTAIVTLAVNGGQYQDKDFDPKFTDFTDNSN